MTVLDSNCTEQLRGSFECTDWYVFLDSCSTLDELCDTVSSYINFCEDNVSIKKVIKCFPNNKPWITKDLKLLLNEKKCAFKNKDKNSVKNVDKQISEKIKESKEKCKQKSEHIFK